MTNEEILAHAEQFEALSAVELKERCAEAARTGKCPRCGTSMDRAPNPRHPTAGDEFSCPTCGLKMTD